MYLMSSLFGFLFVCRIETAVGPEGSRDDDHDHDHHHEHDHEHHHEHDHKHDHG